MPSNDSERDQEPQGSSFDQVAKRFESLLSGPEDSGESDDQVQDTDDTDGVTTAGANDALEGEDDAEQVEAEPELEPEMFDVGSEKVTLDELRRGYLRQSDYTKKTQAAAELRKQAEADVAAARAERDRYADLLPRLEAALRSTGGDEPDWDKLRTEDPGAFADQYAQWQLRQRKLEAVRAEHMRVMEREREDQGRLFEARKAEEREKLLTSIPTWRDAKVYETEGRSIAEHLIERGFTPQEIDSATVDHRVVLLARDAHAYRTLKGKATPQRGKPAIKTARPGSPGTATPVRDKHLKDARARLRKTGSVRDAANLFDRLLTGE